MKLNLNTETVILIEIFIIALLLGMIFNHKSKEHFQEKSLLFKDTWDTLDKNAREIEKLKEYMDKKIKKNNDNFKILDLQKQNLQNMSVYELTNDIINRKNKLVYNLHSDF